MATRFALPITLIVAIVVLAGCGGTEDLQSAPETQLTTTAPTPTEPAPETTETETHPEPKPKPTTITIRVVEGRPLDGIQRPSVRRNERVVLIVRSDVADEVHLHGYDISREVASGGRVRIGFVAKIPGRFELELENIGVQLAELTVR